MRVTVALLLLLAATAARADEVQLKDGSIVVGRVEERGDDILVTRGDNTLRIPRSMVKKIVYAPLPEELYERRLADLKPGDLEGHVELARWCAREKLKAEAESTWRKVLEIDPDHAEARKALGYTKLDDGRWATEEEAMAAKGLVKHEGKWVTPAERDAAVSKAAEEERLKEVRRRVRRLINDLGSGSDKRRQEAARLLSEIAWPDKLESMLDAISGDTTPVRRYAAAALGDYENGPAASAKLVRAWLADGDEEVRKAAGASLQRLNDPESALTPLIRAALGDRNDVRARALDAIKEVKDRRIAAYLLDLWEHNQIEASLSFSRDAGVKRDALERKILLPDGTETTIPRRLVPRHPMEEVERKLYDREREIVAQENAKIRSILRGLAGEDLGEDLAKRRGWVKSKPKTDK